MKIKLTTTSVRATTLPADTKDAIFFDADIPGFGLRLRDTGSRTFVFQYGRNRRVNLGAATPLTLAEARKSAAKLYAQVQLGADPARDEVEARRQALETFKPFAEKFLHALQVDYRLRSYKQIEHHLLVHARPLHALPIGKIDRRDVAGVIMAMINAGKATTANRVRSSLSGFFNWLIAQGLLDINPVDHTPRSKERSRDRVLTPAELRLIWNALDDDQYGAIIKLLALTAQRAAEIGDLRWSEIGADQILLPAERTKNKRAHIVPLSAAAVAIIATQPKQNGRDTLFGNGLGYRNWSDCKEGLDQRIAAANGGKPIPHWTTHDLRRSAATMMADELGVAPHIIEAILNHVGGHKAGVSGIYNRASYLREKRAALDLWADRLLAIADGRVSNVVALKA